MKKWQSNSLFRFLSSLKLAVISILTLAAVLAVATVFESWYGMRGAHALVYGQVWFFGVLGLLATNVLCAALSRYPWKRRQIGFVLTHLGILTILAGSWVTMRYGVDGNLPVVEGKEDGQVILNGLQLMVGDGDAGTSQAFPVTDAATERTGNLAEVQLPGNQKLVVTRFLPRAKVDRVVEKGPAGIGVPAVRVEIYNERFSLEEWLVASEPDAPAEVNLGPAILTLRKLWNAEQQRSFEKGGPAKAAAPQGKGFVILTYEGKEFRIDIESGLKGWQPIGQTGLKAHIERYLPYAVVEHNELVNRSNDPVNPTVQLRLRSASGAEEKHTLFANFPDFATLHRQSKERGTPEFGVQMRMIASQNGMGTQNVRGKLHFAQSPDDGKLLYRITGKQDNLLSQGVVEPGKEVPTGWMDLRFRVSEWVPAAVSLQRPRYVDRVNGSENYSAALEVQRVTAAGPVAADKWWLVEGSSVGVPVGDRILEVAFARDRLTLPFQIHLSKFQMGTDPGTTKAATYESDVEVRDPAATGKPAPKAHISMNEPLDYGGYTFYQASYQIREGQPPLSVFSVNFDPGRWVKYAGSLIMVLGILLMFYFNPHYWDIVLGRKRT